jgi:hypothetical protein
VALQTTGVERNSSDLHLHQEQQESGTITGNINRAIQMDRPTPITSTSDRSKHMSEDRHRNELKDRHITGNTNQLRPIDEDCYCNTTTANRSGFTKVSVPVSRL